MRKFHTLIFAAAVVGTLTATAQHDTAGGYQELNDGAMPDAAAWNAVPEGLQLSWASKDVHYRRREVPALKLKTDPWFTPGAASGPRCRPCSSRAAWWTTR